MKATRKVTVTMFCCAEDAEDVRREFHDEFFLASHVPMWLLSLDVAEPSDEENAMACENLDIEGGAE